MKYTKIGHAMCAVLLAFSCAREAKIEPVAHNGPDSPGYEVDTRPITLDWYVNFDWFNFSFGGDAVSQKIVEDTGITINYIKPAGAPAEKLNTMIASDSLPDLLTIGWWEAQIPQLIEAELVWPLDELAQKYDPYFLKVANPQRLAWYRQSDGYTYGYPNASYTPSDLAATENISSNFAFEVRKDIYEAIGRPDMRTPEGFLGALQAAQQQFPEVDGQPLIPLGLHEFGGAGNLSLTQMLPDFLAIAREKEDRLHDYFSDPEYRRWLEVLNRAYLQGLLRDDVFIDKRAQMEEKITQGRYFAMLYQHTDFTRPQSELYKRNPEQIYIAVDGPANRNLDAPTLRGPGINGWTLTLISKKSRYPDRAIRLLSYLVRPEGQRLLYLGVQGQTWDMIEGREQLLPEISRMIESERSRFDTEYGALFNHWMLMDNAYALPRWEQAPKTPQKELVEWGYGKATSISVYADTNPEPGSKEDRDSAQIALAEGAALPKLLRAQSNDEFDQIYRETLQERERLGLAEILAYRTKRMQENKNKLGN